MNFNNFYKIENFRNGDKTINNINYTASASFESNSRVNTSMMVDSLTNIINNSLNDVKQSNGAEALALGFATNTIGINDFTAKNFNFTGIKQDAHAIVNADVTVQQKNVSTIVNEMENSIQKNITKESNISNTINQINDDNQQALQESINAIPPIPNVPKPAASDHISNFFGIGNTTTNNISATYESSVKKMLEIDDSFTVSDNNNIKNDLLNYITTANYATCQTDATARNLTELINIEVEEDANISIEQISKAETNLKCAFNQTNISKIANKIVTQISTTINNLYEGIKKNPTPAKYDFLHHLGAAISDKVISASGTIPSTNQFSEQPNTELSEQPNQQNQQNQQNQPNQPNQLNQQNQQNQPNQSTQPTNNTMIYIFVGIIIIIFVILILIFMMKKN